MMASGSDQLWGEMPGLMGIGAGLVVALLALAWVAVRMRAWYYEDDDPAGEADQMLSEIREIYQEGDLSEEEFRSIKSRLIQRREEASADKDE